MGMRLLYLSYWGVNDPLTQSVIMPRLQILSSKAKVDIIVFCTIERDGVAKMTSKIHKVKWIGLNSTARGNVFKTKFFDFLNIPKQIKSFVLAEQVELIIANSPLAGAIAWQVSKKTGTPFIVDCFEPHADYMVQSGVWSYWDLRYLLLTHWEKRQRQHAWQLFPVSKNYFNYLLSNGVDRSRLQLLPNTVDIDKFSFNERDRKETRAALSIGENATVGIYVGKFGGIYYEEEAFDLFQKAFQYFGALFRLLILTVHERNEVIQKLQLHNINPDFVFVNKVPHEMVPKYLSAADFAFATIKPAPCRKYCSPVKDGEYWANGLPVLLEDGIGDDSDIIKQEGGGVILQPDYEAQAFESLTSLMKGGRSKIKQIAQTHRGMDILDSVIHNMLSDFENKNRLPTLNKKYS